MTGALNTGAQPVTGASAESLPVTYQDWSVSYGKRRFAEYGEAEARRRYTAREGFWILFGDPDHPQVVVEVEPERYSVEVTFLDGQLRRSTTYLFVPEKFDDPDLILLAQHRRLRYDTDDAWAPSTADAAWIKPDGHWYRAKRIDPGPLVETRGQLTADQLAELIEPFPAFGDWSGITRHRQLPPGPG